MYKRQVLFTGETARRAVAIGCIAANDSSLWNACSEKNEQKQWHMKNGMPVSYTHLDVYKRQAVIYPM